jgi:putative membrane protein
MMHFGNFSGMGVSGFGFFGWIFMVIFWAVIILGIIYLAKQLIGYSGGSKRDDSAEDILGRRYASGEITRDEYEEKLSAIRSTRYRKT